MRQVSLALAVAVGLTLLPGVVWAGHLRGVHREVSDGATSWGRGPHSIGHERNARPFVGHGRHFVQHGFGHPHFHGLIHPHFGPTFIVVDPPPGAVWVPGFWHWDGFRWVWVPGRWAFPGHRLVPRNPCD